MMRFLAYGKWVRSFKTVDVPLSEDIIDIKYSTAIPWWLFSNNIDYVILPYDYDLLD